jgi:hypothetical protein
MNVIAEHVVSDQGTIVVFEGRLQADGRKVFFGVDHRIAEGLDNLLADGEVDCYVEDWQLL